MECGLTGVVLNNQLQVRQIGSINIASRTIQRQVRSQTGASSLDIARSIARTALKIL